MGYNVVYEYTPTAGLYAGNRYWTTYKSKDAFDSREPAADDHKTIVIAEGVAEEEAIRIHRETPLAKQFATAFAEADTGRKTEDGRMIVIRAIFELQVANVSFMNGLDVDKAMDLLSPLVEYEGPPALY